MEDGEQTVSPAAVGLFCLTGCVEQQKLAHVFTIRQYTLDNRILLSDIVQSELREQFEFLMLIFKIT